MDKKLKLWFAAYGTKYEADDPFFFSIDNIPIAKELEQNYAAIYEETKMLWQKNVMDSILTQRDYHDYDDTQFPPNSWKKLVFRIWGIDNKYICDKFPLIASYVKNHPEITSCFITKLAPHSIITGHSGISNAQYRIHLGLQIPVTDAELCGIEVGNQKKPWQNGKAFAFLDGHYHHVWNKTDQDRYLLIVDVCRPEFRDRLGFIYARVIVSNLYFPIAIKFNTKFLYNITKTRFLDVMAYILYVPIKVAVWLNSKISFLKL